MTPTPFISLFPHSVPFTPIPYSKPLFPQAIKKLALITVQAATNCSLCVNVSRRRYSKRGLIIYIPKHFQQQLGVSAPRPVPIAVFHDQCYSKKRLMPRHTPPDQVSREDFERVEREVAEQLAEGHTVIESAHRAQLRTHSSLENRDLTTHDAAAVSTPLSLLWPLV